jgi:predicted membrane channel-forming protein YqfA (hemolysin III family)
MHHSQIIPIELITGISYLMILVGFGVRNILEGGRARLLWPWLLVSIFGLCGITRLDYVGVLAADDSLMVVLHLALTASALAYGVGQLIYACWPELFEEDRRPKDAPPIAAMGDGPAL